MPNNSLLPAVAKAIREDPSCFYGEPDADFILETDPRLDPDYQAPGCYACATMRSGECPPSCPTKWASGITPPEEP